MNNPNQVHCIKCEKEINTLHPELADRDDKPESKMWNGGVVGTIAANYGSNRDGDIFVIGVCDDCIAENPEKIQYLRSYM